MKPSATVPASACLCAQAAAMAAELGPPLSSTHRAMAGLAGFASLCQGVHAGWDQGVEPKLAIA